MNLSDLSDFRLKKENTGEKALGRTLISGIFLMGGVGALTQSEGHAMAAQGKMPHELAVWGARINGGVQLAAGALFAAGVLGKTPARALALTLLPVTFFGHPFWEKQGAEARGDLIQVLKNLALLGAVVYVAGDQE